MRTRRLLRSRITLAVAAVGAACLALVARQVVASDHQDTPTVELSPRFDVNDVYAFPGETPGSIALVLGTSSPLTPAQTPLHAFGDVSEELYQLKVDNNGDAKEDLVFQVTFNGSDANQTVTVRGPVAPGAALQNGGMKYNLITSGPVVTGATGTNLGTASGTQVEQPHPPA